MILLLRFALGLILGSFLNVLIYRLPRGEGFVAGRSRCPSCGYSLSWSDLIPIVSWLVLRARCRSCHVAISPRYPLVELVSGIFAIVAPTLLGFCILELAIVVALIDFDHLLILDSLLIVLVILAVLFRSFHVVPAAALMGGFFALWYFSRGLWIGFGDVKLAGVLGLLFGFTGSLFILYGAVLLGGLVGGILLVARRATMKTALPFGLFLMISTAGYVLFEGPLLHIFHYYW